MEFISSIFLSLATFFGLVEVPVEMEAVTLITHEELVNKEDVLGGELDQIREQTEDKSETVFLPTSSNIKTMIIAGGCFWSTEVGIESVPGVINAVAGFSGGHTENPSYSNYAKGGHREAVEVTYDSSKISYRDILIVSMKTTDPTDDDGTFYDRGDKYSAAFYYENEDQRAIAEDLIKEMDEFGPYDKPLAIDIEEQAPFWAAADKHQNYASGVFTKSRYDRYKVGSGREGFVETHWGENRGPDLPWRAAVSVSSESADSWINYKKPDQAVVKSQLDSLAFNVTQHEGTERAGTSPLDKNYEDGIYVDVLSGEPLYSSKDKYDSHTGWPSFTRPITEDAVTEQVDTKLFSARVEIRSTIADNHLGHVFNDGPTDSTGLRYCMNGVALKFIPRAEMEKQGYGDFLKHL